MSKQDTKSIIASGKLEDELLALKLGVERSDQSIFITDKEGVILYINPAFEEIYGFSGEEVLGKKPSVLKSGKESEEVYKKFWDDLLDKKIVNIEIINKTKDGKFVDMQSTANPIIDKGGEIIGFLAIQSDITEKKQLRHELIDTEARYRDIVENSPNMIHSVDENGIVIFTNKRECELLGYTKEELIGMHIHEIYIPSQRKELDEGFEILKKKGVLYTSHGKMVKKNGEELDVEIDSISVKDERGNFVRTRSIIRDITEQRKSEEELTKKVEQMEFMGRVNLKRYEKMLEMQKEIIDLKKRLGEDLPNMQDIEKYCPER